jgi:adhesin/invasin
VVHVTAESGAKNANYTLTVGSAAGGGNAPGGLAIMAGQGQILFANFTTNFDNNSPFVVKLTDSNGNPLANTKVTFTIGNGGIGTFTGGTSTGTLNQSFVTTDSKGIASINFAAGPLPQLASYVQDVITAKAPNSNTVTFYLSITTQAPSPTARVTNETPGAVITGQAGTVVKGQFSVLVLSPLGAPIPNVSVRLQNATSPNSPPAATCVDPTGVGILTDATGTANCDLMLSGEVGSNNSVSANIGYQLNTFSVQIHITPGPPGLITKLSGDNQSGKPGTKLPAAIVVQVSDGFGNVLPGVKVTFAPSAGLTLSQVSSTTDGNGKASALVTLGNSLGPQTVTVTAGTAPPAIFTETVITAAANLIKSGDLQTTIISTAFPNPIGVEVTDSKGSPVSGVPLAFAVIAGSATLSATNVVSDANGNASVMVTAGPTPGPITITASVPGTNILATFTLTANKITAAAITIVSGNSQTALVNKQFANPLVVNVTDSMGNPVSGAAVTFAVVSPRANPAVARSASSPVAPQPPTLGTPNAITDANGSASTTVTAGSEPGTITINATTAGFSATFTLTAILPGPVIKSVVNGASFQHGISPGSVATIIGTGLATGLQGVVTAGTIVGPLQTTLAGVTVTIHGIAAPIYSVSNINGQEQVTFQVPFEVPVGSNGLTVSVPNGSPTTIQVNVQHFSPGIFEYAGPGHFAVLIRPDGSYVSADNPTHPGETVIMFADGLGQTNPAIGTNQAGAPGQNVVANVIMGIGPKGFAPTSVTTYAGVVGVYEVTFTIPMDATTGAKQALGLGVRPSAGAKPVYAQTVYAPIE